MAENEVIYQIKADDSDLDNKLNIAEKKITDSTKKTADTQQKHEKSTLETTKKVSDDKVKSISRSNEKIVTGSEQTGKKVEKSAGEAADEVKKQGNEAEKSLDKNGDSISTKAANVAKGIGKAFAVVGAAVVGVTAAVAAGTKSYAEHTDAIDKVSLSLGLSKQAYQEWDYIIGQNGGNIETMKTGLNSLNNVVDDTLAGNDAAISKFQRLGISLDDLAGKSREEIFERVIFGLQGITDEGERAAIANELLGKSSVELAALLDQSVESTEELRERAHELGLILSDDAVNAGVAFGDALEDLTRSLKGVGFSIIEDIMPIATEFIEMLIGELPKLSGVAEVLAEILVDLMGSVFEFIKPLMEFAESILPEIMGLLNELAPFLTDILGAILPIITELLLILIPVLMEIAEALLPALFDIFSALMPIFDTVIMLLEPILALIQNLLEPIQMLISNGIAPLINTFLQLIHEILEPLMPIINYLIEIMSGQLAATIERVTEIFKYLTTTIDNIRVVLSGIIDFITGVFTGDWEKAWGGVAKIFSGVWNQIKNVAQLVVNSVIDMINSFISGINVLLDWVGIKIEPLTRVDWTSDNIAEQVSEAVGSKSVGKWDKQTGTYTPNTQTGSKNLGTWDKQTGAYTPATQNNVSSSDTAFAPSYSSSAAKTSSYTAKERETTAKTSSGNSQANSSKTAINAGNIISITSFIPTVWDDVKTSNKKLKSGLGASKVGNSKSGKLVSGLETVSGGTSGISGSKDNNNSSDAVLTAIVNMTEAFKKQRIPVEIVVKARDLTVGKVAVADINEMTQQSGKNPLIK